MSEITTVKVSMETRDLLKSLKRGGESFDALIRRLMREKEIAEKYIYVPTDWGSYQKELLEEAAKLDEA